MLGIKRAPANAIRLRASSFPILKKIRILGRE
jgi:hypothetical protein